MPDTIEGIKSLLEQNIGEELVITVQLGRRRERERRGILKETYRSVFIVDLDEAENNFDTASFSYRDVLTDEIQVEFAN